MTILDGKTYAQQLRQELKEKIENSHLQPTLCIINIGDDPASKVYVRNKEKACEEAGILCLTKHFDADATEVAILDYIEFMNSFYGIHAIMVQLPLPKHLNTIKILNAIAPEKDVDGLTYVQSGKLQHGDDTALVPCTPQGIIKLLKHYDIELSGKHCVVIGRSNIVGKPMATLLLNEDATVTVCHSKTSNLKEITRTADVLVVALGKSKFITADYVKDGAVVVDVGINRHDGKLCGDVDFEAVKDKCSYITPVPGGVGVMTVASLLANVVKAAQK